VKINFHISPNLNDLQIIKIINKMIEWDFLTWKRENVEILLIPLLLLSMKQTRTYNKHRCSVIEVNTRSAHLFDKGISLSLGVMWYIHGRLLRDKNQQ
jgi:hypothetical protein